jgi:hypothetical protein
MLSNVKFPEGKSGSSPLSLCEKSCYQKQPHAHPIFMGWSGEFPGGTFDAQRQQQRRADQATLNHNNNGTMHAA